LNSKSWSLRLLGFVLLAALLFFALRNAPLVDIWNVLKQLTLLQITTLVLINILSYVLVTLRWWLIVQAEKKTLAFAPMILIRVAVFGVSYFTLGPQVGGEPLQVLYLQRRQGMTYTRATSTVIMDKLLEFLVNFVLLALGSTAVFEAGFLSGSSSRPIVSLIPLAALAMWPIVHITLMIHGKYPVGVVLRAVFSKLGIPKWVRFIIAAERMAGMFCQRHTRSLILAVFVSLLAGVCMLTEYALIASFLQINVHGWQIIAAWTASWLSFLVPVPGGLGALEASQVFALGVFQVSAASAISVTLIMRARDLLIGSLGLLFAGEGVKDITLKSDPRSPSVFRVKEQTHETQQ
jgi:glycosyltransferase 2 family protein